MTSDPSAGDGERKKANFGLWFEVACWVLGFLLLNTLFKGLAVVFPALGGAVAGISRLLFQPCFWVLAVAAFVLWKLGKPMRDRARRAAAMRDQGLGAVWITSTAALAPLLAA